MVGESQPPKTANLHDFYRRMVQSATSLQDLYAGMEGWGDVVVKSNPILECQKGCARCCMHQVLAGEEEWKLIHTWMRDNLTKAQRQTIIERVIEQMHVSHNPLSRWLGMRNKDPRAFVRAVSQGFRSASTRCPMLDDGGRCEIYPVRPFVCRSYGRARMPSGNAMICEVFAGRFRQQQQSAYELDLEDMSVMSPKYFELSGDLNEGQDGLYTLLSAHLLRNRLADGDLSRQPNPLAVEKTYPVVTKDDFPTKR